MSKVKSLGTCGGKFVPKVQKLDDGSFIFPADGSLKQVTQLAKVYGVEPYNITPDRLQDLLSGESVEAASGITITNWSLDSIKPDLSGEEIDPIVPAKIAFEFLALHCGSEIYENPPQLASIRCQLTDGHLSKDDVLVERLDARNNRLFHGLVYEGNNPGARVQIRLFGSLAFRVEFCRLSISSTRYAYTHDLVSGSEYRWSVT